MIKLPDTIVIYPQKANNPRYLLCWIPSRYYDRVARTRQRKNELENLYPNGIEVELSASSFLEAGIELRSSPEALHQAYLDLAEETALPESRMVAFDNLKAYIDEKGDRSKDEMRLIIREKKTRLAQLDGEDLVHKIMLTKPPMTEGEEAREVYQRLSRQGNLRVKKGDE